MITGAAGCIGSALAEAVVLGHTEQLVLVDMSEQGVYEIERHYREDSNAGRVIVALGNICDADLMTSLLQRNRPQIIFHAAAFKHVPLLEQNPFAAIANNTLGTAALARLASEHGCERFIFVSTDKAADPISIMGASKRIAEMALLIHGQPLASTQTIMLPVRLGNVLNSPGSVVPLFEGQIASGISLTITDPGARRYFITIEEAVAALVEAASGPYAEGVLIPRMNDPVRIDDLASYMFSILRPESPGGPDIRYVGLRPGDKMNETLLGRHEVWDEPAAKPDEAQLRRVVSPLFAESALQGAIVGLQGAVRYGDLTQLIHIVRSFLPDYQPSAALLASQQPLPAIASGVAR